MGAFPLTVPQRRLALVGLVALALLVVVWRHSAGHAAVPAPVVPVAARQAAQARPAPALVVDVAGAVRRPGLYRLAQGARVADAVRLAGGLTRRADPVAVNLAAPVVDGEQVVVGEQGGAVASGSGPASPAAPVSLNSASADQLDTLPGVGPVTAQKIVQYREQHGPFRSVDELDAISGIGPARIQSLQGLVTP